MIDGVLFILLKLCGSEVEDEDTSEDTRQDDGDVWLRRGEVWRRGDDGDEEIVVSTGTLLDEEGRGGWIGSTADSPFSSWRRSQEGELTVLSLL